MSVENLAGVLHGGPFPCGISWDEIASAAVEHGVSALLAAEARRRGCEGAEALAHARAADAALAILQSRELQTVVTALAARGVSALVIKGAHLQWTHYPSPELRPRHDTDLVIEDGAEAEARAAIEALGYRPLVHVTGEVAFAQFHYWRLDGSGARHALDVHRRVVNPRAFADVLRFGEMKAERVPLVRLGPDAWGPSPVHALAIAAIHRAAHHGNADRLIWLYDVHLLGQSLTPADWQRVAADSAARAIAPYVLDVLMRAKALLGTNVPRAVIDQLSRAPAGRGAGVFSGGGARHRDVLISDWRHLKGWRLRARFLREHLFPPRSYMRSRYAHASPALLPLLYVHRAVAGAVRQSRRRH